VVIHDVAYFANNFAGKTAVGVQDLKHSTFIFIFITSGKYVRT